METVLRQDIPRYSFKHIYERFPFDTTDPKLKRIHQLEEKYTLTIDRFVKSWKTSESNRQAEPSAYIRALQPQIQYELNNMMFQITDLLQEMYDVLIEYCNVQSENVLMFQDHCEEVYEWFDDMRRQQQARIRKIM